MKIKVLLLAFVGALGQDPFLKVSLTRRNRAGLSLIANPNNQTLSIGPGKENSLLGPVSLSSVQTNSTSSEPGYPFQLENYLNYQYYGALYIGSENTYFEYIFDTGSPWLWIPTTDCNSCAMDGLFETSLSASFIQQDSETTTLTYNTGEVSGYISTERFCLAANNSYCVDD
jgi:hypothetical protein